MESINNVVPLTTPIEFGGKTIDRLVFHKPNLKELTRVKSDAPYAKALEMLEACSDQPKVVLERLGFEDTQSAIGFLSDFLGLGAMSLED